MNSKIGAGGNGRMDLSLRYRIPLVEKVWKRISEFFLSV